MKQPTIDKALKELENYFGGTEHKFNEGTKKFVTSIIEHVYDGGHCDGYAAHFYDTQDTNGTNLSSIEDNMDIMLDALECVKKLQRMFDNKPWQYVCDTIENDEDMSFGCCNPKVIDSCIDVSLGCVCVRFNKVNNLACIDTEEEVSVYDDKGEFLFDCDYTYFVSKC